MTTSERQTTVVRDRPATMDPAAPAITSQGAYVPPQTGIVQTVSRTESRPGGATIAARIVVVVFGILQLLIGLRVLLLAIDAREGNALVSGILNLSQPLVALFEGLLRTNALQAGGAVLDLAAVAALVGWTILELVILAVLRIWRPSDAV